jgi:hypothetical protein
MFGGMWYNVMICAMTEEILINQIHSTVLSQT